MTPLLVEVKAFDALATVMGIEDADPAPCLPAPVKSNFGTVFADEHIAANLKSVLTATASAEPVRRSHLT